MDFGASSDPIIHFALLSGSVAIILTGILLVNIVLLRRTLFVRTKHRKALKTYWRPILVKAIVSDPAPDIEHLPPLRVRDVDFFLHEWNLMHDTVRGPGKENLNELARRLKIDQAAIELFHHKRLRHRLVATTALGHLQDQDAWDPIVSQLNSSSAALSMVSATSLVCIDPQRALPHIIPLIAVRDDWPPARIGTILKEAGADAVSEPLCQAIRQASPEVAQKLLMHLEAVHNSAKISIIRYLLDTNKDGRVLSACLRSVDGPASLGRVQELLQHERWHIRMLAATALGRIGRRDADQHRLRTLLSDNQWWVRYRAAQALAELPFMTTGMLRDLQEEEPDRYARDILEQVIAEAEMA